MKEGQGTGKQMNRQTKKKKQTASSFRKNIEEILLITKVPN